MRLYKKMHYTTKTTDFLWNKTKSVPVQKKNHPPCQHIVLQVQRLQPDQAVERVVQHGPDRRRVKVEGPQLLAANEGVASKDGEVIAMQVHLNMDVFKTKPARDLDKQRTN